MTKTVTLIGVPLDLGAGRRGVDMGPSAFRLADIHQTVRDLGYDVIDAGDVEVAVRETRDPGDPRMKYLAEIRATCEALRDRVGEALAAGARPVVLGGDHSIAMGTIAGVSRFHRERGQKIGPHLVRRPRRHEHRRDLALGQHPRHAPRGRDGHRRAVADRPLRRGADGRRRARRGGGAARRGHRRAREDPGLRHRRLHHARHRRARHARGDGGSDPPRNRAAPRASTSASTWTASTPTWRRASAPPRPAASPTARLTLRWRCSRTPARCCPPSSSR